MTRIKADGALRRQQSARVFEANIVRLQGCGLARLARVVVIGMFRRDGEDQIQYRAQSVALGPRHGFPPAGGIVGRIGNAYLLYAVGHHALEPKIVHRVGCQFEGAQTFRADGAQRRPGDFLGDQTHALEGILAQLAHTFFDMARGDQLDGLEAGVVDAVGDGEHHACAHVFRPQTRLTVAQSGIDKFNFTHKLLSQISR